MKRSRKRKWVYSPTSEKDANNSFRPDRNVWQYPNGARVPAVFYGPFGLIDAHYYQLLGCKLMVGRLVLVEGA